MIYILNFVVLFAAQPELPGLPPLNAKTETPAKTLVAKSPGAKTPTAIPAKKVPTTDAPTADESDVDIDESGFFAWLDRVTETGAIGLLRKGGWFMAPILILGIIAVGVMIERFRSLRMLAGDSSGLRDEVRQLLQEDRVEEALEVCDSEEGPVPAILAAGLRKYLLLKTLNYDPAKIEEQVIKAMDDYSVHVVAALEKHLPILGTVSSVAPMLGFLGTVAGMVTSFQEIEARIGEENIVKLAAAGISVALLTTAFGLIVGIPAYMAFNYFSGVINRFVLEVEESATEMIEVVTMQVAIQRRALEDSGDVSGTGGRRT